MLSLSCLTHLLIHQFQSVKEVADDDWVDDNWNLAFTGGYLDFLQLTELKKIYITEIYMKKRYKSSITKNHEIKKQYFYGVPLKGYVAF